MRGRIGLAFIAILFISSQNGKRNAQEWGFFGHRLLNKMAVFTLPPEMIGFYKKHIDFISKHGEDPDKRRYSNNYEGFRHYIDLDEYGEFPFPDLPRSWSEAMAQYLDFYFIDNSGNKKLIWDHTKVTWAEELVCNNIKIDKARWIDFVAKFLLSKKRDEPWVLKKQFVKDNLAISFKLGNGDIEFVDNLTKNGINPYFLPQIESWLTYAFKNNDTQSILKLSAEIGHYIGDAHVPLHTTSNYNGQETNQHGIHAFWETRIPELFAFEDFDFFVGKAEFIINTRSYYWDIVLKSHSFVDEVLETEKKLSRTFPVDGQYCYVERNHNMVQLQCAEYTKKYDELMDNMVEARFRESILSIGSIWYTAWTNAGKPILDYKEETIFSEEFIEAQKELDKAFGKGEIHGRMHDY